MGLSRETQIRNTCPTNTNWSLEKERDLSGLKYTKEKSASNNYKVNRCLSRRKMLQFLMSHAVGANVLQVCDVADLRSEKLSAETETKI